MSVCRRSGFTIVELMTVVAIVGILTALGAPLLNQFFVDQHAKHAARAVADLLVLARSEAVRTGRNQIVFFQTDADGNALVNAAGSGIPALLLQDDAGASNGKIDAGERRVDLQAEPNVNWGVGHATGPAPGDADPNGKFATGQTFRNAAGAAAKWVVFRPDGVPRAFSAVGAYAEAGVGTGNGALYLTNGRRDYAVILSALGGVRVSSWDVAQARWRS